MANRISKHKFMYAALCVFLIFCGYAHYAIRRSLDDVKLITFARNILDLSYRMDGVSNPESHFCVKSNRTFFDYIYQFIPIVTIHAFEVKYGEYVHVIVMPASEIGEQTHTNALNNLRNPKNFLGTIAKTITKKDGELYITLLLAMNEFAEIAHKNNAHISIYYTSCQPENSCLCEENQIIHSEIIAVKTQR